MKKHGAVIGFCLFFALLCTGCATFTPAGCLYTGSKAGISAAGDNLSYSKIGTAESHSILALVAWGDGSIQTAVNNGKIKKIKYVDYEVQNILGIYGTYRTIVYGD